MYKQINFLLAILILSLSTFSQNDEINKNEFYLGYSGQAVEGSDGRPLANGFEVSYTRNFSRYLGIRTSVSAAFRERSQNLSFNDPTSGNYSVRVTDDRSVYNVLGGLQFKDNSGNGRVKPFGYILGGIAYSRNDTSLACVSGTCPTPNVNNRLSDTGFGAAFGGGIDVRINRRIDLRLIQADFNPIYSSNRSENNFRFGVGIVFK